MKTPDKPKLVNWTDIDDSNVYADNDARITFILDEEKCKQFEIGPAPIHFTIRMHNGMSVIPEQLRECQIQVVAQLLYEAYLLSDAVYYGAGPMMENMQEKDANTMFGDTLRTAEQKAQQRNN